MASLAPQILKNPARKNTKIAEAVNQKGMLERAFSFAFKGLVYAQIWEDPVVDMEALQIQPDSRLITIASGGCNALSYLTANPKKVKAVDLNTAHIALNCLKMTALRHLPDYAHLHRFFVEADNRANIAAYEEYIRPELDETSRRYWEGRDLKMRRRINGFADGVYRRGLLGHFIGVAHILAKIYRIDLSELLKAQSIEEQRAIFEEKMAPVFDTKFIRWLTSQPPALFGLGIPPAQFDALAGDQQMADVLKVRLEKLACDFAIKDNYFARQAFGRGYGTGDDLVLPPWLEEANYEQVRDRVGRINIRHANFTERLGEHHDATLDRYILLDAQDWMNDQQLTHLWCEITRTARKGARVLFRTAAVETLLPGRVPEELLALWDYRYEQSLDYTARDRSSIYGGVHLYILK